MDMSSPFDAGGAAENKIKEMRKRLGLAKEQPAKACGVAGDHPLHRK
jgi:hypothetical protein